MLKAPAPKTRLKLIILALIAAILLTLLLINAALHPKLVALASAQARGMISGALNQAILANAAADASYSQLMSVGVADGRVYLLQANTAKMNLLAANTVQAALDNLTSLGKQGVSIPMGTLSGVSLFAGLGPNIRATFLPVSGITSKFRSQFLSAGVNQTLHRIELLLSVTVEIALPGGMASVTVETGMPVAESVIVGEVPSAFTDVANQEDMLNLIPFEPME